jgi:ABC-type phosphate/phosphonate transport system substrate-binding protein
MYDWPELRGDWNRLWREIRVRLTETGLLAAARLRRAEDPWRVWLDPNLLVGQTCGWPYVNRLHGHTDVFGRFDFGLKTRKPGDYFSVFVKPPGIDIGDLRTAICDSGFRLAVNMLDSQSGFRAFGALLDKPLNVAAGRIVLTGSHRESIRQVASGHAELAAIDANSWRFALRHEPAASGVEIAGRTPEIPGLPLITANAFAGQSEELLASCRSAIESLPDPIRARLGLRGVVKARAGDYLPLRRPPYSLIAAA